MIDKSKGFEHKSVEKKRSAVHPHRVVASGQWSEDVCMDLLTTSPCCCWTDRRAREEQKLRWTYVDRLWDVVLITPFVAPAPSHMPIEVASVRVREHPHEERTPSEVVSWTAAADRDASGIKNDWTLAGGRRPTKGRSVAESERPRWRDE